MLVSGLGNDSVISVISSCSAAVALTICLSKSIFHSIDGSIFKKESKRLAVRNHSQCFAKLHNFSVWVSLQMNGGQAFPPSQFWSHFYLVIEAILKSHSILSVRNYLVSCYLQP